MSGRSGEIVELLSGLDFALVDAGLCSWQGYWTRPHPHDFVKVTARFIAEKAVTTDDVADVLWDAYEDMGRDMEGEDRADFIVMAEAVVERFSLAYLRGHSGSNGEQS